MARRDGVQIQVTDTGVTDDLARMVADIPKVKDRALKKGAIKMGEEIEKVTPVGPYRPKDKYGKGTEKYSPVHMKDDVKYQKDTDGRYKVGYGKNTAWRAHFINNGTVYISPTFFFDKVVEAKLPGVYDTIADEISRRLFK